MSEPTFASLTCPVVVLRVRESQVRTDTVADALRDELLTAYEHSAAVNVVVDLEAVAYLSSTGIRPLLALNKRVREREGRFILCGLRPDVEEVLTVSRLVTSNRAAPATFEKQADVVSAIASLYQHATA